MNRVVKIHGIDVVIIDIDKEIFVKITTSKMRGLKKKKKKNVIAYKPWNGKFLKDDRTKSC